RRSVQRVRALRRVLPRGWRPVRGQAALLRQRRRVARGGAGRRLLRRWRDGVRGRPRARGRRRIRRDVPRRTRQFRRPGIHRRVRRGGAGRDHRRTRRRRGRPHLFLRHGRAAARDARRARHQFRQQPVLRGTMATASSDRATDIQRLARQHTPGMVKFLRDLIAIPSESAEEGAVVRRIADEMTAAGFDEIKIDGLGNILGRVGSGRTVVAIDGHVDTVGVGDPSTWTRDPYRGELKDGIVFGRGAGDQEGGVAAAVYGARILRELGLDEDVQVWVTGTVMEEDCDGLCWQYILREHVLAPDVVVITEPTNLAVYRGHRGRMELEVRTQGLSCHGSAPERGVNAVYKMAPIVSDIERL